MFCDFNNVYPRHTLCIITIVVVVVAEVKLSVV